MNLFNLMAKLGLDTAEFEKNLQESEKKTKGLVGKLKEIGTSNEKVNKTFKTLGTAAKVAGGAMAAGLGVGVNYAVKLDDTMKKLQAQTGKTDEEMKEIEKSLRGIYKSGAGESIDQIGEAFAYATQVMGGTNEELEKVTTNAFTLSDTFGYEVNASIEAVNGMMNDFGITSEQAFNILAQGSQQGANAQGDLLETVREFGPAFQEWGFTAEEMMNVFITAGQDGAFQINKVADAMNEFATKAIDGNEATQEAFKELGFSVEEVEGGLQKGGETAFDTFQGIVAELAKVDDKVKQEQLGVALFGTMWEDMGGKAILSLGSMNDMTNGNVDTMSGLNKQYDTLGGFITEVKRSFEDWALTVVNQLLPPLRELKEWISKNKELVNFLAGAIMGVVAAILVYKAVNFTMALVSMGKAMIAAIKTTGLLTTAQTALNGAMMLNPIGLIIGLIIGLVAAFIYLWNTSEGFRNFWIGCWEAIKGGFDWAWEGIKQGWEYMKEGINQLKEKLAEWAQWWSEKWQGIKDFFAGIWDGIKQLWEDIKQGFIQLGQSISEFAQKWAQKWQEMLDKIGKVIGDIIAGFFKLPGKLWEAFTNCISKAGDWVKEMATKGKNAAKELFTNFMNGVKSLPTEILNLGKRIPQMLWDGIKGAGAWLGNTVKGWVKGLFSFTGLFSLPDVQQMANFTATNSYAMAVANNARGLGNSNIGGLSQTTNVSLNIAGREFDQLVIKSVANNYGKIENIVQSKERGRR